MRPIILVLVAVVTLVNCEEKTDYEATKLQEDFFDWKREQWPLYYNILGFHDVADRLPDLSIGRFNRMRQKCEHFAHRSEDLLERKCSELGVREKRYVKQVKFEAEMCSSEVSGMYFAPVNFMESSVVSLTHAFKSKGQLKLDSLEDHRIAIKLLRQIPKYVDQLIYLLKEGIKKGYTYPKESLTRVPKQFEALDTTPEATDFYVPFKRLKGSSSSVRSVQHEALEVIRDQVQPAFNKLKDFLFGVYSDNLRKIIGVSGLPDGQKFYQAALEYHTTIKGITPEEVHNIGLDEVRRLKTEMMAVAEDMGYKNMTFKQFVKALKSDPAQSFASREELLAYYKGIIDRTLPKLDALFDDILINNDTRHLDLLKSPGGGAAYYNFPSADGRRKGAFYINLDNLDALKRFEAVSLTLHEGNPGHHMQFSFNKHSPIPDFLRYNLYTWGAPGIPPPYTSHVEGWGLYAEYLGKELGMYEDKNDLLGFYSWNLLRAGRLVVDTGMHVFGWSRERAIDYLLDNTAMSRHVVEGQIDR